LHKIRDGIAKVISYVSRVWQPSERHYGSTRLELFAVVHALKQYLHLLFGRKFIIRTDNAALTSLMRTPEPLEQQGRWLDLISEYDFQIVHWSGTQNFAAGAQSRRLCEDVDAEKCALDAYRFT
jgi:hypothetical protein